MSAEIDEAVRKALAELQAAGQAPGIPHHRTVIAVTFFVLVCFAFVSIYVLFKVEDATIRGAVIGTWTSMATGAAGFWLGASSGGKMSGGSGK